MARGGARVGAGRPARKSANTSPLSRRARARARGEAGNQRPWPADKVERWSIERLIPYAKNARTHTDGDLELAGIMAERTAGLTNPDDAPAVPEHPVSVAGDLWLLGRHRLLCGDSTVATDVERVLGGVEPPLMVTDPPYPPSVLSCRWPMLRLLLMSRLRQPPDRRHGRAFVEKDDAGLGEGIAA